MLDIQLVSAARLMVPDVCHPKWIRYENDCELHKWTMEEDLPGVWEEVLMRLSKLPIAEVTGITDLRCDLARRGAGLHVLFPNGILRPHVDYSLHPCGLERRASLIYFLDDSDPSTGGAFELYDGYGKVVKSIYAKANQAVIFEGSDVSYHGVSRLAKNTSPRVTAASYYLAPPRPGTVRRRATFLPIR